MGEATQVPRPTILDQIGALLSRLDPLLGYLAELETKREKIDAEVLETLKKINIALERWVPEIAEAEKLPVVRVLTSDAEPLYVRVTPTPLHVTFRPRHRNYVVEEDEVAEGKPRELNIRVKLGRDGEYGYIISDEGKIKVRINGGDQISLFKGQALYFHEMKLKVSRIDISTESAVPLAYRLLVV